MNNGIDIDALLTDLAKRVAVEVRAELERSGTPNHGLQPRLLDVNQAAQYLNRSPHSVRHLIAAGKIPAVKLDQRVYVDIQDLNRAIENTKEFGA